jgi:hypothetical protein
MTKPMSVYRALGIAAGLFVVMGMFTNELVRLLAIMLYLAAVLAWVRLPVWRARRAENRRLALDADWQHAALMQGNVDVGVFGEPVVKPAPANREAS